MKYKNYSIWLDTKDNNPCPPLKDNIQVDVLIIGGGMTGLSCAYHLLKSKMSVCIVEKNKVASGVSSRTTGKLTYLQENIYSKVCKYHDKTTAQAYLLSQIDAINLVTNIIKNENIDCDLEQVSSYLFTNDNSKALYDEIELLKEMQIFPQITNTLPNGDKVKCGCFVENTYVFHPLKYLYKIKEICLKNGTSIYENTNIVSINKKDKYYECYTNNNNVIQAKHVVLALHYPFFLFPYLFPFKTTIEKSYIKAFMSKENDKFSAITITKPPVSIRYHSDQKKNFQLYLTGSHNSCTRFNEKDNFNNLIYANNTEPEYIWSNKDIITNDALPFIGKIDNNLFLATGYNTWGMTNGSLAGLIIANLITKKESEYQSLFAPLRGLNKGNIIKFPISLGSSLCSFIKTKVKVQKEWYPNNIIFEKRNGKNIAIYTDENKKEHIVYNICPHLKCSLIFNDIEKTWDCPCHGSRFDIDGNVIEGPSNYNITYHD